MASLSTCHLELVVWDSSLVKSYRNCRRMAIDTPVQQLCREEKVGFGGYFVGRADMFMSDGLHLNRKGASVFTDEPSTAIDSGMCSINNMFGSKHCLN